MKVTKEKEVTKKKSKRLVIDACVASSAGNEKTSHPIGKNCRDFLKYVLSICHQVVFTLEVKKEWHSHKSKFATEWLTSMYSRKKVVNIENCYRKDEIREKLSSLKVSDRDIEAMTKDVHLLEAALASDKIVISIDKEARDLFSKASKTIGEIKEIGWCDPTDRPTEIKTWLEEGAEIESEKLLYYIE
jgi:hypothetical protein